MPKRKHLPPPSKKNRTPTRGRLTKGAGWAPTSHGRCPDCGAGRFPTRKAAKNAGRINHPGVPMREYACGDFWHVGPTSKVVGETANDDCRAAAGES